MYSLADNLTEISTLSTLLLHIVLATWATIHALLNKKDHVSAFGWIATCMLFPLAGPLLYFLFGINRIKTRARQLQESNLPTSRKNISTNVHTDITTIFNNTGLPSNAYVTAHVSYANSYPLTNNNVIRPLFNGEEAYPAMLSAINSANHYIFLSTYIFDNDEIGQSFVNALADAKQRGVMVCVLIDGVGEYYGWPRIGSKLRKHKIKVSRFLAPKLFPPWIHFNLRNHRKLLIVDNTSCFAGGMNISQKHCIKTSTTKYAVLDMHFHIQGSVINQLTQVFLQDWQFSSGKVLPLPTIEQQPVTGKSICRVVAGGPNEDLDVLPMLLNGIISSAQKCVTIITPYFLPPRELISALQAAAMRGVIVNVILPQKNNLSYVHWANLKLIPQLLDSGVQIYYQSPPFAHTKLCLIDDFYCLFGSANLDPRSLALNFEVMVEVYDCDFSKTLNEHATRIIQQSSPINLETLQKQSVIMRLRNAFFWLFSSYL